MSITKGRSSTMKHSRTLRLPALAVTLALAGLVVAACGSSSNTGSNSTTTSGSAAAAAAGGTSSAARSKFVACLKAHGVTLPARPAGARRRPPGGYGAGGAPGFFGGGGGGGYGPPAGGPGGGASRFNNPKFRAAVQACGGGPFRGVRQEARLRPAQAELQREGTDLPAVDRGQQEVPGRIQGVRVRPAPAGRVRPWRRWAWRRLDERLTADGR
jgi:hypothetical protein